MAQWVDHLRNNIFVNPPLLPLLYVKFLEPYTYRNQVLQQAGGRQAVRRNAGEFRNF